MEGRPHHRLRRAAEINGRRNGLAIWQSYGKRAAAIPGKAAHRRGAKERAGDFRTPEGNYRLTRRNARSDFFLSIQVSYPNDQDTRRARRNGWQPGGAIMIHGMPNDPRHAPDYYATQDWTDGCIAVSNADMVEIWMMTSDNVPIDIQP